MSEMTTFNTIKANKKFSITLNLMFGIAFDVIFFSFSHSASIVRSIPKCILLIFLFPLFSTIRFAFVCLQFIQSFSIFATIALDCSFFYFYLSTNESCCSRRMFYGHGRKIGICSWFNWYKTQSMQNELKRTEWSVCPFHLIVTVVYIEFEHWASHRHYHRLRITTVYHQLQLF